MLRESIVNPNECVPIENLVHDKNHVHGIGCGHEAIQHEYHIDYLVGNILHHHHGHHCDLHGPLQILPHVEDTWDTMLNCSWEYCSNNCGNDDGWPNCRCRQSNPSSPNLIDQHGFPGTT